MKRCIAVLLILCLLLACPHALAANEPPEEPGTETGEESLPETGTEEASPAEEAGEPGEEAEESGEIGEEPEEPGGEPEEPEAEAYVPGQFTDVDESRWYGTEGQGVIRLVWELGLMNGMGNGTFLPEGSLRVCEAVKLAAVIRSPMWITPRRKASCSPGNLPTGWERPSPGASWRISWPLLFRNLSCPISTPSLPFRT